MRFLKCLLSVVVGVVLGLCSACGRQQSPAPRPAESQEPGKPAETEVKEKADPKADPKREETPTPKKEEGLPVRGPLME